MSLLTCPDCNNDVSSLAISCPKCGRPMRTEENPPQQNERESATPTKHQSGSGLIIASVCVGIIGLFIWPLLIVAGALFLAACFSTKLECGSCGSKLEPRQKICGVCNTPVGPKESPNIIFAVLVVFAILLVLRLLNLLF